MLNTKYFIQKDPRTNLTQNYQRNDSALGNVWFVKNIRFVKDAAEEMRALDNFHPKDTAVVQEVFKSKMNNIPSTLNSEGSIQLVKNDNDLVTYKSSSAANQFAVFSEIYYDAGWKAFIDGKETPIIKTNYVLRGLPLPAGNHEILFRFEPQGYKTGRTLTTIFSILMMLLLGFGIFQEWKRNKTTSTTA
jgi:uncharacterized membrane protein YfhO